jgi:hypothetical protein
MKEVKIFFCTKRNKWIADPVKIDGNPQVGQGNTPHEALGDLVLSNLKYFDISYIEKTPIFRSDITENPPKEGLQTTAPVV